MCTCSFHTSLAVLWLQFHSLCMSPGLTYLPLCLPLLWSHVDQMSPPHLNAGTKPELVHLLLKLHTSAFQQCSSISILQCLAQMLKARRSWLSLSFEEKWKQRPPFPKAIRTIGRNRVLKDHPYGKMAAGLWRTFVVTLSSPYAKGGSFYHKEWLGKGPVTWAASIYWRDQHDSSWTILCRSHT